MCSVPGLSGPARPCRVLCPLPCRASLSTGAGCSVCAGADIQVRDCLRVLLHEESRSLNLALQKRRVRKLAALNQQLLACPLLPLSRLPRFAILLANKKPRPHPVAQLRYCCLPGG